MSERTRAARWKAFFAALRATGNQTVAAERAKLSRSWIMQRRRTEPRFKAAMDEAVAAAKVQLSTATGVGPADAWREQRFEELAIRGSGGRPVQIARARIKQWTPRIEARFLATLAGCCNVKASCAAVGLSTTSAYDHRGRWQGFAERWDAALVIGYERLEYTLVAAAGVMLGDTDLVPEADIQVTSVREAIQILGMHRYRIMGIGRGPSKVARPRTLEEVSASILRKLEAIERARAFEAREKEGDGSPDDPAGPS